MQSNLRFAAYYGNNSANANANIRDYAPKQPIQASLNASSSSSSTYTLDSMTPMKAPNMGRRQIMLTSDSPSLRVRVVDTEGHILTDMHAGVRRAELNGRGDVAAVLVTINGTERACDIAPALEWIDNATHIAVTVSPEGVCTLSNASPDIRSAYDASCSYMSDHRGNTGLVCE